jgi:hypothetical protein
MLRNSAEPNSSIFQSFSCWEFFDIGLWNYKDEKRMKQQVMRNKFDRPDILSVCLPVPDIC